MRPKAIVAEQMMGLEGLNTIVKKIAVPMATRRALTILKAKRLVERVTRGIALPPIPRTHILP